MELSYICLSFGFGKSNKLKSENSCKPPIKIPSKYSNLGQHSTKSGVLDKNIWLLYLKGYLTVIFT